MKTEWDYTALACAYMKRPGYSDNAIDRMLEAAGAMPGTAVCDIGAGTGHLTIALAGRKCTVTAVEPNDSMRELGVRRTNGTDTIVWKEAVAENTGLPGGSFSLVTFGSSFNVTDRQQALVESHRLLAQGGWFACMWNHRDIGDPIQAGIEGRMLSLDLDAGLGYDEDVTLDYDPNDIDLTLTFGGQTRTGQLGDSFSFLAPENRSATDLSIDFGYSGEIGVDRGLDFNGDLTLGLGTFGAEFTAGNWSSELNLGPVFSSNIEFSSPSIGIGGSSQSLVFQDSATIAMAYA